MNVDLSLVAHTNVGKTSLMRTLLRRDIGEVADRPHVTEAAERHALVQTPEGDVLYLWDTPGFGDSARLLKRLRSSGNPIGWLQTQVWDRFVDRPFFCSQQAIRNARDDADLLLYLVNAGEDEASAAYAEAELQILQWVGKPVLLLLNQTGRPRGAHETAAEEARWQRRLGAYVASGRVLSLDAFARCWVQEDRLLELAAPLLAGEKREALERLRRAWRGRNLAVFRESMAVIAATLAQTAADREPLPRADLGGTLASAARRLVKREPDDDVDPATRAALEAVAKRLRDRERIAADRLIELHGLAGNAKERIFSGLASAIEVSRPVDVAASGALGGLVGGALTGLAADVAAGGLTLGLGALIGGIMGALGGGGAAHAYNAAMGIEEGRVSWSAALLQERAAALLLLYLGVAHYGRARGAWTDPEAPAHWAELIREQLAKGAAATPPLAAELGAVASAVLLRLYPEAAFLSELTPGTGPCAPPATAPRGSR